MTNDLTPYEPPASRQLAPTNIEQAMALAKFMCDGDLVPNHLKGKPADMLMVIEQAVRWGMSPFAVAQCTSVIQGKLMYEGKLVAAAINGSGLLSRRLSCKFEGAPGPTRKIIVSGTLHGEDEPRTVEVVQKDVVTNNAMWKKQEDQQLVYSGSRVWARRHLPEVMLGVYTPEEFEPQKRTMAEISANKIRKERGYESVFADLADIQTLEQLEKYIAETLTTQFMSGLGAYQFLIQDHVEKKRIELSEPEDDRIVPNARERWLNDIASASSKEVLMAMGGEIKKLPEAAQNELRPAFNERLKALKADVAGTNATQIADAKAAGADLETGEILGELPEEMEGDRI